MVLREQKQLTEPAGGEEGAFAPLLAQTLLPRWTAILIGVGCSIEARKPGASSPNAALLPLRECDDRMLEGVILMRCY